MFLNGVRLLSFASVLILLLFTTGAYADDDPIPWNPDYQGIADQIKSHFPLPSDAVYAGKDWCFTVEADPNRENWYMRFGGQMMPVNIDYAYKIKLIYTRTGDLGKTKYGYSSLFVGADLEAATYYRRRRAHDEPKEKSEEAAKGLRKTTATPAEVTAAEVKKNIGTAATITFPQDNHCGDLQDMLPAMFTGEATYWYSLGKPGCDENGTPGAANTCRSYSEGGEPYYDKQTSQKLGNDPSDPNDPLNVVWWPFGGAEHIIPGAFRLLAEFCDGPDSDGTHCKSKRLGYIVIGFGGSGGAG